MHGNAHVNTFFFKKRDFHALEELLKKLKHFCNAGWPPEKR